MKRRNALALLLAATAGTRANANQVRVLASAGETRLPAEVAASLPGARLIGSGRLSFWGLPVYDARLWAADEVNPAEYAGTALAIEVEYARSLGGAQIAERSLDEMKRSGTLAADTGERWLATMKQLFPDVNRGDRITGVLLPGAGSRFYANGMQRGEVRDGEFTRRFFGIWLAPGTSEPKLRAALLGSRRSAS